MDEKTKAAAYRLLKENKIKPRVKHDPMIVISARLTPTGAVVVLKDGRKLTLTAKPKRKPKTAKGKAKGK